MPEEVLVEVSNLSKKFCKDLKKSLWYGVKDVVGGTFGKAPSLELRKDEFWALKNINFTLKRGECLGLIGHNGAGKSTLLRILNGLLKPDAGSVTMRGKVGALIELGAGFNPILTGRENIFNNGAVLGFSKQEIDDKLEEIIDFAEIREFIEMPVRNYSSGMRVRLGFAIAAQLEPDILIIDEVLAVGDASFRAKSFNRMVDLSSKTAMIFVTHSMPQAGRICTRGILMKKGLVMKDDEIGNVIQDYLVTQKTRFSNFVGLYKLENFSCSLNKQEINYGEDLSVSLKFKMPPEINKFLIHYSVYDQELRSIYQAFSILTEEVYINKNEIFDINFVIKNLDLINGKYTPWNSRNDRYYWRVLFIK